MRAWSTAGYLERGGEIDPEVGADRGGGTAQELIGRPHVTAETVETGPLARHRFDAGSEGVGDVGSRRTAVIGVRRLDEPVGPTEELDVVHADRSAGGRLLVASQRTRSGTDAVVTRAVRDRTVTTATCSMSRVASVELGGIEPPSTSP